MKTLRSALAIGLVAVVHALRFSDHFRFPSPFAEEGSVFLAGGLEGHWPLLNAGYLNLFTGITLRLLASFSLGWLPLLASLIAVVIAVANFAYFLLPQWNGLMKANARWALVVFFLCFSPFSEGTAVLEYCFWYFGIGAALLVLELLYLPEAASRWRWAKAFYVGLGALSGPAVFQTTVPILLSYYWIRGKEEPLRGVLKEIRALSGQPMVISLILCGLVQVGTLITHTSGQSSVRPSQWIQLPQATLYQIQMRVILPTFLSEAAVVGIKISRFWARLSFLGLAFLFSLFFWRRKKQSTFNPNVAFVFCR
jgi:hypothetical protein